MSLPPRAQRPQPPPDLAGQIRLQGLWGGAPGSELRPAQVDLGRGPGRLSGSPQRAGDARTPSTPPPDVFCWMTEKNSLGAVWLCGILISHIKYGRLCDITRRLDLCVPSCFRVPAHTPFPLIHLLVLSAPPDVVPSPLGSLQWAGAPAICGWGPGLVGTWGDSGGPQPTGRPWRHSAGRHLAGRGRGLPW